MSSVKPLFKTTQVSTPLGMMLAIAHDRALCFLEFVDQKTVTHLQKIFFDQDALISWHEEQGETVFQSTASHLHKLDHKLKQLQAQDAMMPGMNQPLESITEEIAAYFKGKLHSFNTPLELLGTPFQQEAWKALLRIPYGATKSYQDQATSMTRPSAVRAVANANGTNKLALIVPCHRIISHNGTLGGYGGGLERKKWLLHHELTYKNQTQKTK